MNNPLKFLYYDVQKFGKEISPQATEFRTQDLQANLK